MDQAYLETFLSAGARSATRNEIRELLKLIARPDVISLAGGLPSPETFPVEELATIAPQALREYGAVALQYGPTDGDLELRHELIRMLVELEGDAFLDVGPENVLIVSGSQQALDLCARVFLGSGDVAVCGLPSYLGALGAFTACGARLSGVPLDEEGLRTDLLEQRLVDLRREGVRPKFVYTVPDFQNPAGVTLSLRRRRELLAIAREFDLLILEDTPYRQLRYLGPSEPSLYSLDRDGRVISLFTLSKLLSPGMRLGWVVAHESIIARLVTAKQPVDLCTSGLSQLMAREYLKLGVISDQIARIRATYSVKRDALLAALDDSIDPSWGVSWTRPEGGLFLWVTLPRGMDAAELLQRALERSVAFVTGSAFHCDGSGKNTLRLNFSYPTIAQIDEAVKRLAGCIADALPEEVEGDEPDPALRRKELLVSGEHSLQHLALNLALHELVE